MWQWHDIPYGRSGILEKVVRHILICVNTVSCLEHSFTPCGSDMIFHVVGYSMMIQHVSASTTAGSGAKIWYQ